MVTGERRDRDHGVDCQWDQASDRPDERIRSEQCAQPGEFCRSGGIPKRPVVQPEQRLGSAHVDWGDDSVLLLELADTRARKRALSIATGVGAVAVEELKNEFDR